jgi:nitrile hydratase subunit beta
MTATPKFQPGDLVLVDDRDHTGHCRTPTFVRGHKGRVRKMLGLYKNPEELAYYKDAAELPLYDVVFEWREVWGEDGPDEIAADIFEHWLNPA